jgi:hypothetical protein
MIGVGDRLELFARTVLMGELELTNTNQPWFHSRFSPTASFAALKPLFDKEYELLAEENFDEWEAFYEQIIEKCLLLVHEPSGVRIEEFLLHVKDGEAWFRY